eukprot:TRINITY_DN24865_c0_g1_i1.p1 TRINITY_DN24865_c0_g1~~TRINITY_DN24865_c0_g1_i1.p1  ORF type:complete len:410 (-),score=79.27 TRINITY_DN24865_c0_g1_i1:261-1490(-)
MERVEGSASIESVLGQVLREERCELYWLPRPEADADAASGRQSSSASASLLAKGLLELRALPAPPSPSNSGKESCEINVMLSVKGEDSFFCSLCFPGMDVCIFDDFMTFPAPEDADKSVGANTSGVCALVFEAGTKAMRRTADQLGDFGCQLHWQPRPSVRAAATAVGYAGGALAAGIELTVDAVGGGVKRAGRALRHSGLVQQEDGEVPDFVRNGASMARQGTLLASTYAGKLSYGIAKGAGWVAGKACDIAKDEWDERQLKSEQWHQDAKALASASMDAGAEVFKSFAWAPYKIAGSVADAGCDVLSHKYGDDTGTAARESIHSVGNVLTAACLVSPAVVAKLAAARASQEVAAKLDGRDFIDDSACTADGGSRVLDGTTVDVPASQLALPQHLQEQACTIEQLDTS